MGYVVLKSQCRVLKALVKDGNGSSYEKTTLTAVEAEQRASFSF